MTVLAEGLRYSPTLSWVPLNHSIRPFAIHPPFYLFWYRSIPQECNVGGRVWQLPTETPHGNLSLVQRNKWDAVWFSETALWAAVTWEKLVYGNMRDQKLHLPSLPVLWKDWIVTVVSNLRQQLQNSPLAALPFLERIVSSSWYSHVISSLRCEVLAFRFLQLK